MTGVDLRADFDAVARARGPHLLRVAYQLTHHRSDAEDVVQAALFRVYRSVERSGRMPDDVGAYLRRSVVNEYLRTRSRASSGEVVLADVPDRLLSPDLTDAVGEHDAMWAALGRLRPKHRAALVLRHYEDLDDDAIAAVLGCRRATVRSLCARGLATLAEHVPHPKETTTP